MKFVKWIILRIQKVFSKKLRNIHFPYKNLTKALVNIRMIDVQESIL
jgi:hypothetical protein